METLSKSKQAHFEMCNLLNYPRLQNHPDYEHWNLQIGRFQCFNSIKQILNDCEAFQISIGESINQQEKKRAPSGRLSKLLKDSVLY